MTKTRPLAFLTLLLLFFPAPGPARASYVEPMSLARMTALADRVFLGTCTLSGKGSDAPGGMASTQYEFLVEKGLVGVEDGQTLVFRQVSGKGGTRLPGVPGYKPGQRLILFLFPDGRSGLTSPVGMGQGVFRVVTLADGTPAVVNAMGNRNLSDGGGPIPLEEFLDRVDRAVEGGTP